MKDLTELDAHRMRTKQVLDHYGSFGDEACGVFLISHPPTNAKLKCVASAQDGWDHVSVSLVGRCPNWREMDFIKRRFFKDDEVAMQLHVAVADHINHHPYVLHLWRPHNGSIPLPPKMFV